MQMLKRLKPDYCIAIHHDSNNSKSLNGFDFANIKNKQINGQNAEAIVKIIAEYFVYIQ